MITHEEYQKAQQLIKEYDEQYRSDPDNGKECYVLARSGGGDTAFFVTLNKAYADRVYAQGGHVMMVGKIFNP